MIHCADKFPIGSFDLLVVDIDPAGKMPFKLCSVTFVIELHQFRHIAYFGKSYTSAGQIN